MIAEMQAMEKLLNAHIDEHEQLLACMEHKAQAIRYARIESVTELVKQEQAIVQRMNEIERHRLALARKMTRMIDPDASEALPLSEIAKAVENEVMCKRVLDLADTLRTLVDHVRRQSSILRNAAESLAKHMAGVMQTMQSALSRAGVYGQRGHVAVGTQLEFNIDIKS